MPEVDWVAIYRTMEVLQEPPDDQPVWTYDGSRSGQAPAAGDGSEDENDEDR